MVAMRCDAMRGEAGRGGAGSAESDTSREAAARPAERARAWADTRAARKSCQGRMNDRWSPALASWRCCAVARWQDKADDDEVDEDLRQTHDDEREDEDEVEVEVEVEDEASRMVAVAVANLALTLTLTRGKKKKTRAGDKEQQEQETRPGKPSQGSAAQRSRSNNHYNQEHRGNAAAGRVVMDMRRRWGRAAENEGWKRRVSVEGGESEGCDGDGGKREG